MRSIILLVALATATPAVSAEGGAGVDAGAVDRLSEHPTWRRLLHVERGGNGARAKPAIVTPDFYLTPSVPWLSPRAELVATLDAFERARDAPLVGREDARCRYPARLHWLSRRLPTTIGTLPDARCPDREAWLDVEAIEALSLVHVSGHFANPASAFGHLLLRVESGDPGGVRGLRDLGINFGAVVPPGDGPLTYVLKGLFGGYEAGFTDQSFLAHDAVYSATEQRDMWAYRLGLDADERTLLLFHLWELREARFTYYFLRHNCAWYLSALLELVLDRPLRDERPWQLPSAVFTRADVLETRRGEPLVERVSFVPSLEREFLHGFATLEADEARHANLLIDRDLPEEALAEAPVATLDVLLEWADLGAAGSTGRKRAAWLGRKQALLKARLRHPPGGARTPLPFALPPARGPRSLTVSLGTARDDGAGHDDETVEAVTLRFSPYAHDLLDANRASLRDADFRLGDLSLGVDRDEGLQLRTFDLIAVEKLATPPVKVAGRSRRTWRMAVRLNGERGDCVNCSTLVAKVGAGLADASATASRTLTLYGYVDAELGSSRSLVGPSLGALYRPGPRLALRLEGRRLAASRGDAVSVTRLDAFAALGGGYGLTVSASDVDGRARAGIEIGRRF